MSHPPIPHRCWAEIDREALRHNASVARQQSGAELMAIVKANAYGHGAVPVAQALRDHVAMFGVASLQEALELREGGLDTPVMLLSACLPDEDERAIREGFHVCVNTLEEARALNDLAARLGQKARTHAVLDTGMGRMGFLAGDWHPDLVRQLVALPHLQWEGIASHMPSPDEDAGFTRSQVEAFRACVQTAVGAGLQPRWRHLENSAGLLGYPEARDLCNLARPGLMLYGVDPLAGADHDLPPRPALRPALTWKTRVTLLRDMPAGHGISYGRTHITTRPVRVATLACGYADGYPRQVSGQGAEVLLRGRRCPVLGRVTMDQIMVDVTSLPEPAQTGDEAVLLGRQGTETITAETLARQAGTISWHIFTSIGRRVGRIFA